MVLLQELGAGGDAGPGDEALRDDLKAPALARSVAIVAHPVGSLSSPFPLHDFLGNDQFRFWDNIL